MKVVLIVLLLGLSGADAFAQTGQDAAGSRPTYDWRDDDTAQAFAGRLRAAAYGTTCETETAAFRRLAEGVRVELPTSDAVAGRPVAVTWARGEVPADLPATWIVASLDTAARFSGDGFYALTTGAMAPFGLSAGAGRSRALAALYGPAAPESGQFGVVPLVAGQATLSLDLVAWSAGCGQEMSAALGQVTLHVAASPEPVFFVRDPFSFERPARIFASADGASQIEVFTGRWRLVDAQSEAVLAEREGTDPAFSPTGRFAIARTGDYREVVDTVDGSLVATIEDGDIAWENADSFVLTGGAQQGLVDAYSPLVAGWRLGAPEDGSLSCTVCPGLATSVMLDLENDVALRAGGQGIAVNRLSGPRDGLFQPVEDPYDEDLLAQRNAAIDDFVLGRTLAMPMGRPVNWNLRGGLKLTSRVSDLEPTGDAGFDAWQARVRAATMASREAPPRRVAAAGELTRSGMGQSRGVSRLGRPKEARDGLAARLAESGIVLVAASRPGYARPEGAGAQDGAADVALGRRIASGDKRLGRVFQPHDFGCVPDGASEKTPKIFAMFDNAYEFKVGKRSIWLTAFSCKWTAGGGYEPLFYLFDPKLAGGLTRLGGENPAQPNGALCTGGLGICPIDARLVEGRLLLVWSRASRAMLVRDIEANRTLFTRFDLPRGELLKEIACTAGCREIVQVNSDGSYFLFDLASGEQLLEGRYVDDETVMWTPDLRFQSTAEGANYVNLRFPGQAGQHTFQQFAGTLRRADLVKAVLGRAREPETGGIGVPPRLAGLLEPAGERIRGRVEAWGATELRIYQDGLLSDTLQAGGDGRGIDIDIAHMPGARHVAVVAADATGLVSRPSSLVLPRSAQDVLPVVHALTIGIDTYAAPALTDLAFAARDATTLLAALRRIDGKSVRLGSLASLVDAQAGRDNILAAARKVVAGAQAGDTIMLSFAGHGLTGPDGRFYMALQETDPQSIGETALAWDDLAAIFADARARVVVFLDACHSGAAGTGFLATSDAAAGGVLKAMPPGLLVFSASKGRQLSEEAAASGGGVFTNAVADVIARSRADFDLDGNGAIEVSELYAGVKLRVSNMTEGRQVPWLARNELVGDFALF